VKPRPAAQRRFVVCGDAAAVEQIAASGERGFAQRSKPKTRAARLLALIY
jgi:hypothetical protein